MTEKTNWRELAQNLRTRDDNAVNEINGLVEPHLEDRIELIAGRVLDALWVVHKIMLWIAEQEEKEEQQ